MSNVTTDRPSSTELAAENIFEDALGLFGARQIALGEAGGQVEYTLPTSSAPITKLRLKLPDADHYELFAHYLWNGAVWLADQIAQGNLDVRMKSVVELGAGAGLPSLVCALMGARRVVITDYPDPHIISTLRHNVTANLPLEMQNKCVAIGHKWGEDSSDVLAAGNPELVGHSDPTRSNENRDERRGDDSNGSDSAKQFPRGFEVILLADTMWLSEQHPTLLDSCCNLLAPHGEIWVVGSDHKGIDEHRKFLELATSDAFKFHLQQQETIQLRSGWNSAGSDVTAEQSSGDRSAILQFYKLTKCFE